VYAFLIAITIVLPGMKPVKGEQAPNKFTFQIFDHEQYNSDMCRKAVEETAHRAIDFIKRRMPFAIIQAELSCALLETRRT
jgi:hypothetical protein